MTLSEELTTEIEDTVFVRCMRKFVEQLELKLERKHKKEQEDQDDQPEMPIDPDAVNAAQAKIDAQQKKWQDDENIFVDIFAPKAGQSQAEYLETPHVEMPEEFNPDCNLYDEFGKQDKPEEVPETFCRLPELKIAFNEFTNVSVYSLNDAMQKALDCLNKWRKVNKGRIFGMQWSRNIQSRACYRVDLEIMYIKED